MSENKIYDEKELLVRISEGDEKAFASLFNDHWKNVYGHTLAYVKIHSRAEEITQDIFLKLWKNRQKLAAVNDLNSYLFILGKHQVISAMRKKLETPFPLTGQDIIHEDEWVPGRQLELKQVNNWLVKTIETLPPVRRQVFKMSRFENKSHKEIAEELGLAPNTVKQHIVLALNSLRAMAAQHPDIYIFLLVTSILK